MREAILVHDPARTDALGSFAGVENEGFLEANRPQILAPDHSISASGLPVARCRHAIGPIPVPILPISRHVEVPFFLPYSRQRCYFYSTQTFITFNYYYTILFIKSNSIHKWELILNFHYSRDD